ncbi:hypothetical protein BASA81_013106 [Batrachochytrium salamandrivorans]|nr:hypothetical protein BASA81_013106 [Batrachochytrium salamandrivorans]
MLARMDALWTARKAIQIGILVDTHPFSSCIHCILCDQQLLSTSIAHLVVECEQVTGHRIQSGLPAIQKSRLRLLGRALDPGVENVYTLAPRWILMAKQIWTQQWLDGTVEHESMGTRHDNRALAARLADFLQGSVPAVSIHIVEIPPGSPCEVVKLTCGTNPENMPEGHGLPCFMGFDLTFRFTKNFLILVTVVWGCDYILSN